MAHARVPLRPAVLPSLLQRSRKGEGRQARPSKERPLESRPNRLRLWPANRDQRTSRSSELIPLFLLNFLCICDGPDGWGSRREKGRGSILREPNRAGHLHSAQAECDTIIMLTQRAFATELRWLTACDDGLVVHMSIRPTISVVDTPSVRLIICDGRHEPL